MSCSIKKNYELAPGNVLQILKLKQRLKKLRPSTFLEIGAGRGQLTSTMLSLGMSGIAFDLNFGACRKNSEVNKESIDKNKLEVRCGDFFQAKLSGKFDVIISSMVLEHMSEDLVARYIEVAKSRLSDGGHIILFVPANMRFWSLEDDIAGHLRRYNVDILRGYERNFGLELRYVSGVTFPVSNILFPISKYLVKKNEINQLDQSQLARTVYSGDRNVPMKSTFPRFVRFLVNETTLRPFFWLQEVLGTPSNSHVLYSEFSIRN